MYYYTVQPILFLGYAIRQPHFVSLMFYNDIGFYGSKLICNVITKTVENVNIEH